MIEKITANPFFRNSAILFGGTMLANAINYLFHLLVGRMVSVEVYGEIESLTSLINIISVPAMTLTFIATRYASHSKATGNENESRVLFRYLNGKILKYGWPFFLVFLALLPQIRDFLKIESLWPIFLVWLMMVISIFSAIPGGILNGWQKFKSASWVGIWGALVKLVSAIVIIRLGFELSGAIGGFLLGVLASYLAAIFTLRFIFGSEKNTPPKKEDLVNFASIKKYALPVLIGSLSINILGNADMLLAKHNLDQITAGNYGALTIVSKIIFFATGVIATVLFSMSAEKDHRKEQTSRTLKMAFLGVFLTAGTATLIYYLFPQLILSLLFGDKYVASAGYLVWFAILVTFYSLANLFIQYLLSIKKTFPIYGMLIVSGIMAGGIFFFGHSIYAILEIAILSQILAVFWGLIYLKKYA